MVERFDALIVPADNCPDEVAVKKSILFFDSVTLANSTDSALVNDMEVVERFPNGMSLSWAHRNDFPRSPDYLDGMARIISDTAALRSRSIVRVSPVGPLPVLDAGMNYLLWHSAIASADLMEAATPDRHQHIKPPLGLRGYMEGAVMSINDYKSKYQMVETRPRANLSDADEEWTLFAGLRLGRALKFIRLSNALGLSPLAFDLPNQRILNASAEFGALLSRQQTVPQGASCMHLDLNILEPEELNKSLKDMSWNEVQKLRKHILPGMNNLRSHLRKSIELQGRSSSLEPEAYQKALISLNLEFQGAKEKLANEWDKLKIAAICKVLLGGAGGAYLANGTGLIATLVGVPWVDTLTKVFGAGLVASSTLSSELQALIPARRIVRQHPLYFSDRLPGKTK